MSVLSVPLMKLSHSLLVKTILCEKETLVLFVISRMFNHYWYCFFYTVDIRSMITHNHYHYSYKRLKYGNCSVSKLNRKITFRGRLFITRLVVQFLSSYSIHAKKLCVAWIPKWNSMGGIYTVLLGGGGEPAWKTKWVCDDSSLAHSPTRIAICLHHTLTVYATSRASERLYVFQEVRF